MIVLILKVILRSVLETLPTGEEEDVRVLVFGHLV